MTNQNNIQNEIAFFKKVHTTCTQNVMKVEKKTKNYFYF